MNLTFLLTCCSHCTYELANVSSRGFMSKFSTFGGCWLAILTSQNNLATDFWLPTTSARCTRRPHPPHSERGAISRAAVAACEECGDVTALRSEVQTFSWGLCLVSFCVFCISTMLDHCSTPKSRCRRPPLKKRGRPI